MELQRGSRARELKNQSVIKLFVNNFLKSKNEARVLGKKPKIPKI